jgi:hypothetical protein
MGVQKMILHKGTWFRDPQDWGMELCAVTCVWADLLHMDKGSKKPDYADFPNFMNKVSKTYFLLGLATV